MAVTRTVKFDPKADPDTYLTKEERELRAKQPRLHQCAPPSLIAEPPVYEEAIVNGQVIKELKKAAVATLGPGSIWVCDECDKQKIVVHLGVAQTDDSPPLAWRNR